MSVQLQPNSDQQRKKRRPARLWFLSVCLCTAALLGWLAWPSDEGISPYELSREDGRSRFYATAYPKIQAPPSLTLFQRFFWGWEQFKRRHKPNPAAYTFPASPVRRCSIDGLLNQCMEVGGTHYLIAVEIAGSVEFGHTNALNGVQWVAAFERALETSEPILCYDYTTKRHFKDTPVLIREKPNLVKVVPRTKLSEYNRAGLVSSGSLESNKE